MQQLFGIGFFILALYLAFRWYVVPRRQKPYGDDYIKALKKAEQLPAQRHRRSIPLNLNTLLVLLVIYAVGAYAGLIPFDVTARERVGIDDVYCELGWFYPWPPGSVLLEKERGDYYYTGSIDRGGVYIGLLGYKVHNITTGEESYHPRMYCTMLWESGRRYPAPGLLRKLVTRLLAPYDARLR